jgi:carbonic anhydrase
VVGHTQCGGATACYKAVLSSAARLASTSSGPSIVPVSSLPPTDPINVWLKPLTSLAASMPELLNSPTEKAVPALVEANVKHQVANVAETHVVRRAWKEGKDIWVHGWVFEIEGGILRDLDVSKGPEKA